MEAETEEEMEIGEREEGKRQPRKEEGFGNVKGYGDKLRNRVSGRERVRLEVREVEGE